MRRALSAVLAKVGGGFLRLSRMTYESAPAKRVAPWFRVNGDKTLRLQYDLDQNSIVFDLGGYEGQWASDIFSMYRCRVLVFEPVEHFAAAIRKRFERNPDIVVHQFGLAHKDTVAQIGVGADGSSLFKATDNTEQVHLRCAAAFLQEAGISTVDLMKINIEGGEYDLLEHLIETGFIQHVRHVQVQFHDFVPDADLRMHNIKQRLQKTHSPAYEYLYVWESWSRRLS